MAEKVLGRENATKGLIGNFFASLFGSDEQLTDEYLDDNAEKVLEKSEDLTEEDRKVLIKSLNNINGRSVIEDDKQKPKNGRAKLLDTLGNHTRNTGSNAGGGGNSNRAGHGKDTNTRQRE